MNASFYNRCTPHRDDPLTCTAEAMMNSPSYQLIDSPVVAMAHSPLVWLDLSQSSLQLSTSAIWQAPQR